MTSKIKEVSIQAYKGAKRLYDYYWQHWGKIHLIYIPLAIFITIGVLVIVYSFRNMKQNNTDLTNVSFAMFVTLASASFSYARTYDPEKDKARVKKIIGTGETALQAAICFLFSSALKYINLRLVTILPKGYLLSAVYGLIYITYFLCFILAFYFAIFSVFHLNTILVRRFHEPKDEH